MIEGEDDDEWDEEEADGLQGNEAGTDAGGLGGQDDDAIDPMDAATPFLLHGVTGSGKTEIYMRAIDYALERGQQAIVLVPEIALTPQTVRRFAARFPGRVAVLHSALSDGERYDTWRRARQGLFDIAIGPRSALFAPLPNLGVIIVDEEHDASYKQTPPVPAPYYHARDAAIALAGFTGATIILGSATPDVVTYHRARSGRYQLLELPRRIMGHRQRITGQAERLGVTSHYQPFAPPTADRRPPTVTAQGTPTPLLPRSPAPPPAAPDDIMKLDDALTIPLPPIQLVDMRQAVSYTHLDVYKRQPRWDGAGHLTENQRRLIDLLRERGDQRGRQIGRVMKKSDWTTAATQLVKRNILRRATVLDPPRAKPKQVRLCLLYTSRCV